MMTEQDEANLEIFRARKAVADAKAASVHTDATAAAVKRSSDGIRTIVEKNGYVERFRHLLQGSLP